MYSSRKEAKAAGWFSRRHKSSFRHVQSMIDYKQRSGKAARRRRAIERAK